MAIDATARAALKREARAAGTSPARLLEIARADPELAKWIAGLASTPAAVLGPLGSHPMPTVVSKVAKHPSTPGAVLEAMSLTAGATLLKTIAKNPATLARTLDRLARDGDDAVLRALAERPHLPAGTLDRLAREGRVRLNVLMWRHAAAIGARPRALEALMTHADRRVRAEVGGRVPLDAARAERLFADPEPYVVASLANNDALADPARWRERVFSHPDARVRVHAARNLRDSEHVARFLADADPHVRAALAQDMQLAHGELAALARDPEERVRFAVADRFFDVPGSVMRRLARDASATVRAAVAGSRHAPVDALEALAADDEEIVRLLVAANDDAPVVLLRRLAEDPSWTVFDLDRFGEPPVALRLAEVAKARLESEERHPTHLKFDFQGLFRSRLR